MWTLGINWSFHDSAAALVCERGEVVAMVEEERISRHKHAWGELPVGSVRACLASRSLCWADIDVVAVGWDLARFGPWGEEDTADLFARLSQGASRRLTLPRLELVDHHLAHATVAFHGSGWDSAGVLVADGSGEQASISAYHGSRRTGLRFLRGWDRLSSLGSLYEGATRAVGFRPLAGGKLMGLAPFGSGRAESLLDMDELLAGQPSKHLDGLFATGADDETCIDAWKWHMIERFGLVTLDMDHLHEDPVALRIAASAQLAIEDAMAILHAEVRRITEEPAVCLAGGVALNCVANGRLPEPLFVPPIAHDAGVALGAAWHVAPPQRPSVVSPFLGVEVRVDKRTLEERKLSARPFEAAEVSSLLACGAVGAVASGRAKVGPRALGHRSIIARPAPAEVRTALNLRKVREPWRPLAPVARSGDSSVLWPDQGLRSRFMTGAVLVPESARDQLAATVHVDGSTRPQSLTPGDSPVVEAVLAAMTSDGLPPVLVNTSFNGREEPIVNTFTDAVDAFQRLDLDFLVADEVIITRQADSAL